MHTLWQDPQMSRERFKNEGLKKIFIFFLSTLDKTLNLLHNSTPQLVVRLPQGNDRR